jgi:hypothetical protein
MSNTCSSLTAWKREAVGTWQHAERIALVHSTAISQPQSLHTPSSDTPTSSRAIDDGR